MVLNNPVGLVVVRMAPTRRLGGGTVRRTAGEKAFTTTMSAHDNHADGTTTTITCSSSNSGIRVKRITIVTGMYCDDGARISVGVRTKIPPRLV